MQQSHLYNILLTQLVLAYDQLERGHCLMNLIMKVPIMYHTCIYMYMYM